MGCQYYRFMAFVKNHFIQNYTAGFDWQRQELNTQLYRVQNSGVTELAAPNAVNDLNWVQAKFYTGGNYSFTNDKITAF